MTNTRTSTELEAAVIEMAAAGQRWREAVEAYEQWARGKGTAKTAAIARIMREPNPLNRKPHSVASAESVAESDDHYRRYLAEGLRLQLRKMEAEDAHTIAQYRCLYHANAHDATDPHTERE